MTQTPYQPPVTVGAQAPSLIAPYHYRSPRGLANWLTGALLAQAVSWGAMGTIDIVATLWVPGYSADEFAETGLATGAAHAVGRHAGNASTSGPSARSAMTMQRILFTLKIHTVVPRREVIVV